MSRRIDWTSSAVLLFGAVNAILYCSLLPLWEGFDETFHYAYVQQLSTRWQLPVLGRTTISEEVWQALQLQPVSHYIQASTRAPISFLDYFGFPQERRTAMRKELEWLPKALKYQEHAGLLNYEVNQPPLPYLAMAVPDRLMSGQAITRRVLVLRLLFSVLSLVLLWAGIRAVARLLLLPEPYAAAATFCVFCSQMLYGAIAHVSNDTLAVPLMVWLLWAAIRAMENPGPGTFAAMGVMLGLGLLMKAYYLFLAPLAFGLVCWQLRRRRATLLQAGLFLGALAATAGPWYYRNVSLYHDLAGTGEKTAGFGLADLCRALANLPWLDSIAYMATSSLWTGNNSFTTFSARTLSLALALIATGAALYLYKRNRWRGPEMIVITSILLFCAGLVYITAAFFYGTKGAAIGAVPWYAQVLLAPVMLIAFLGMARTRVAGRAVAVATLLVWTYLIAATYLLKLIPLYGGFNAPRAHLAELLTWYLARAAERSAALSGLCLAPAWWIAAMTAAMLALAVTICARLLRRLYVIDITVR